MHTATEIFEENRRFFSPVSPQRHDWVCPVCLGPLNPPWALCHACERLFNERGADRRLRQAALPMTAALNPGPWYLRLSTYKKGRLEEYGPVVASLAHSFLARHEPNIEAFLGGVVGVVTIVPSKRGVGFADQPLRKALSLVRPLRDALRHTLSYVGDPGSRRFEYFPQDFEAGPDPVVGQRVLLVEDAWVTGSTAISAAGALLREGAEAVAVAPLGRVVDSVFWPDSHPYREAMTRPYDLDAWPRPSSAADQ